MNIQKILNELRNPFTEQLTEDEFDIVTEVHGIFVKLYMNNDIILDDRHNDEYWIRPVFENFGFDVWVIEDDDSTDFGNASGIGIYHLTKEI